jgi:hypothetical protein
MIERDDRERRTRHDRSVAPATHDERVRPVEGPSSVVDATVIGMLRIRATHGSPTSDPSVPDPSISTNCRHVLAPNTVRCPAR